MNFDWKAFIGPIIVAVAIDLVTFLRARQANPKVRFAWERTAERVLLALLASFGLGTDLLSSVPVDVAQIAI